MSDSPRPSSATQKAPTAREPAGEGGHLECSPGPSAMTVKTKDGRVLQVPAGWALLPPGDAGLTRRVKQLGPSWGVAEMRGRKKFSRGLWAPSAHIEQARGELDAERATPAYQKKLDASRRRRAQEQADYVQEFEVMVADFLAFSAPWIQDQAAMARAVSEHATPVGSGTVARTERIPVAQRAEAAVIAWMRHQTTVYDSMKIERKKGARREVRRELAIESRRLLDRHRGPERHAPASCPLCQAIAPLLPPGLSSLSIRRWGCSWSRPLDGLGLR